MLGIKGFLLAKIDNLAYTISFGTDWDHARGRVCLLAPLVLFLDQAAALLSWGFFAPFSYHHLGTLPGHVGFGITFLANPAAMMGAFPGSAPLLSAVSILLAHLGTLPAFALMRLRSVYSPYIFAIIGAAASAGLSRAVRGYIVDYIAIAPGGEPLFAINLADIVVVVCSLVLIGALVRNSLFTSAAVTAPTSTQ